MITCLLFPCGSEYCEMRYNRLRGWWVLTNDFVYIYDSFGVRSDEWQFYGIDNLVRIFNYPETGISSKIQHPIQHLFYLYPSNVLRTTYGSEHPQI